MPDVTTSPSQIHGQGLFAARRYAPGEIILAIDDTRVVTDATPLDPMRGEHQHHCDYLAGGMVVLMQQPERFINHRCDPNAYIRTIAGSRYVISLAEIGPGDEICFDYCINGEGDTLWSCSCGSAACRKWLLSGFFHLSEDLQRRYLALLDDWFIREHQSEVLALTAKLPSPAAD
jgi:hypothetical protein